MLGAQSPPGLVSRLAYHSFPGADPREVEAFAFAVGMVETEFQGRQNGALGYIPAKTSFGVKFSSQLRADAHVSDYDAALGREQAVLDTLAGTNGLKLVLETVTREIVGDGTVFLGHVRGFIFHTYTL